MQLLSKRLHLQPKKRGGATLPRAFLEAFRFAGNNPKCSLVSSSFVLWLCCPWDRCDHKQRAEGRGIVCVFCWPP